MKTAQIGGHSSTNQFTIGLVSDCPTATVYAGKRFRALTDSGAAISLMCMSVYNMIEDHYKTSILPAGVHLKQWMAHPCHQWERQPSIFE